MTGVIRELVRSLQRSGSDKIRGRKSEYCTDNLENGDSLLVKRVAALRIGMHYSNLSRGKTHG
jgi:hypothetical protein